jgi:hypothetical protein
MSCLPWCARTDSAATGVPPSTCQSRTGSFDHAPGRPRMPRPVRRAALNYSQAKARPRAVGGRSSCRMSIADRVIRLSSRTSWICRCRRGTDSSWTRSRRPVQDAASGWVGSDCAPLHPATRWSDRPESGGTAPQCGFRTRLHAAPLTNESMEDGCRDTRTGPPGRSR